MEDVVCHEPCLEVLKIMVKLDIELFYEIAKM